MDTFMKKYMKAILPLMLICASYGCAGNEEKPAETPRPEETAETEETPALSEETEQPAEEDTAREEPETDGTVAAGEKAEGMSLYTDENGDSAMVPDQFTVSGADGEHTIRTGLVVIAPDESEYVWVPTDETTFVRRDFGSYFSYGSAFGMYSDETELPEYREMAGSVRKYGGFYIGRYEASRGADGMPASKKVNGETELYWRFSPQSTTELCQQLYTDNNTVKGFFLWAVNYDTALAWLIDSGAKTEDEISRDSTSWGNYSNDTFSVNVRGNTTGQYEEAKANNIYDLAGNNWEWTQERYGNGNYVMRGGGYNLMGGSCPGDQYPAALRDPLPGNDHHPNVVFRTGLYLSGN